MSQVGDRGGRGKGRGQSGRGGRGLEAAPAVLVNPFVLLWCGTTPATVPERHRGKRPIRSTC
eukprot:1383117-Pyramimonas_sp.AAC.1